MNLNPPWPRVSVVVYYDNAVAAITWLCAAFGFSVRLKVDGANGDVVHSELMLGDGLIMVDPSGKHSSRKSPQAVAGANTQSIMLMVDDADAHCAQARAHGAKILKEPTTTDYGAEYWSDRCYEAEDLEGHRWWVCQRIRNRP